MNLQELNEQSVSEANSALKKAQELMKARKYELALVHLGFARGSLANVRSADEKPHRLGIWVASERARCLLVVDEPALQGVYDEYDLSDSIACLYDGLEFVRLKHLLDEVEMLVGLPRATARVAVQLNKALQIPSGKMLFQYGRLLGLKAYYLHVSDDDNPHIVADLAFASNLMRSTCNCESEKKQLHRHLVRTANVLEAYGLVRHARSVKRRANRLGRKWGLVATA